MKSLGKIWLEYAESFDRISSSPESDFRWLVEGCLSLEGFHLATQNNIEPNQVQYSKLIAMLERRKQGEPVAYILGEWDFYGRSFLVGPGVLVPRSETELIIDLAKRYFKTDQKMKIADFGSGSGCLAITLAKEFPNSQVLAFELEEEASKFINSNVKLNNLQPKRIEICTLDINDGLNQYLSESFDLIVANPPYISVGDGRLEESVKKFEPANALYSGDQGFFHLKKWAKVAARLLTPRGVFLCEIGQGQSQELLTHVTSQKEFGILEVEQDLKNIPRTLIAIKN